MVGDYISTSYSGGTAHPIFSIATTSTRTVFQEFVSTTASGLFSGAAVATAGADQPISRSAGPGCRSGPCIAQFTDRAQVAAGAAALDAMAGKGPEDR